ncbi:MAG: PHP domain-containing protein, partial [Flavobacteriaceae bacterium]
MYLIFDTETTGLPKRWDAPITDTDNWPRCVQIAWQLHDEMGRLLEHQDFLIRPDDYVIPYEAEQIHGISTELATDQGKPIQEVLQLFETALSKSKFLVGQNVGFDINIMGAEFYRLDLPSNISEIPVLDTCTEHTANLCKIPGGRGGKFKLPTLTELHQFLFEEAFHEAHNATADVEATTRCFLELIRRREFSSKELDTNEEYFLQFTQVNNKPIAAVGIEHINLKEASGELASHKDSDTSDEFHDQDLDENFKAIENAPFVHLHNHSQFSVLQSTIKIKDLVARAASLEMPAVALTDHANMMGAFRFVDEVNAHNKRVEVEKASAREDDDTKVLNPLIPIVGCEFFVCDDHRNKNVKDYGYQIVLLAKNKNGYKNLTKMSSLAYTDGFYYVPRIDKDIVKKYSDDIIALTGN